MSGTSRGRGRLAGQARSPTATRGGRLAGQARSPTATRAGQVAIVGLPNAGKSTLLNRVLGEKVAITSPKPQTTRRRVAGILTRGAAQAVLVDTPGLLEPSYALQQALAGEVARSLDGVDLVLLLRDLARGTEPEPGLPRRLPAPAFLVLTKADLVSRERAERAADEARAEGRWAAVHAVSAVTGEGVERLVDAVLDALPEGGFLYDPEQISDRSLRFLAAELVREALFHELGAEVPYACHVEVTAFEEDRPVPRVEAVIHVERESQKGIVIGRGGAVLRRVGTSARAGIEHLAGRQVFLQLRVKVRPNWRRRPADLRRFGYLT
jgi:GTP-binding protein Era